HKHNCNYGIDSELVVDTVTASTGLPLAPPPPQASSSLTFNYNLPPYTRFSLNSLTLHSFSLLWFSRPSTHIYQAVIFFFPKRFATPKQRAWILTALSSFFGFLCELCLGDLAVGHYKPMVSYFHHSLYTFMVTNLVQRGLPSALSLSASSKPHLPHVLGSIHKPLRTINSLELFMYPASVLPLHQQRRLRKVSILILLIFSQTFIPESTTKSLATPRKDVTSNDRLTARHKRPQRPSASTSIDAGRRSSVSGLKPIDMTESGNAIS
ncbi:hypothetical protein BC829DRAFT_381344, partial [Chytridium lagenaria]